MRVIEQHAAPLLPWIHETEPLKLDGSVCFNAPYGTFRKTLYPRAVHHYHFARYSLFHRDPLHFLYISILSSGAFGPAVANYDIAIILQPDFGAAELRNIS